MAIRLNKFIGDSGCCSRREADRLIEMGRVIVNGNTASVGDMIEPGDRVEVDDMILKVKTNHVYLVLNKPVGITCTTDTSDPDNIVSFVNYKKARIFNVGRLDKDSQGLIIMTDDGDIVNKILRAGNNHEKEYIVEVNRPINDDFIRKMSSGVRILGGVKTLPCKVTREGERGFRIILTQGLNRQIRRMTEALGYDVVKLKRLRVMNLRLGGLGVGQWRHLTDHELMVLKGLISDSSGNEQASVVKPKSGRSNSQSNAGSRGRRSSGGASSGASGSGRGKSNGGKKADSSVSAGKKSSGVKFKVSSGKPSAGSSKKSESKATGRPATSAKPKSATKPKGSASNSANNNLPKKSSSPSSSSSAKPSTAPKKRSASSSDVKSSKAAAPAVRSYRDYRKSSKSR